MSNLVLTALKEPGGLWVKLINGIEATIGNFGWTIILFTLIVKLVLSVLDFFIKWSTRRSTLVQQRCAPQIEKIKRKYPNNQQMVQSQTMAIYKKEGYNVMSSCLIMLANLVLTILVFFSIFTALKEVSAYQAIKQYDSLRETIVSSDVYTTYYETNYDAKLSEALGAPYDPNADYSAEDQAKISQAKAELASSALDAAIADDGVKEATIAKWNEVKDNWLWITNIWVTDGKADPLPTYSALKNLANGASGLFNSGVKENYVNAVASISETEYNKVTKVVQTTQNGWNGYYILAVLAAGLTFLSTYVAELGNKVKRENKQPKVKKNQFIQSKNPQTQQNTPNISSSGTMKFMKILMPALMVVFVLTSSSAFGIYVVSQSAISILLSYLINLIVKALTKKQEEATIEFLDKYENKLNK